MSPARTPVWFVALAAALVVACGAAEKSAPPAESPSSGSRANDTMQQAAPNHPDQRYAPPPPTASTQPSPSGKIPGTEPPRDQRTEAWFELQTARGELDATTGDCMLACKALASMDRATSHVCSVSPDETHCGSAKETLKTARRRVRTECMACPNGVSVDPDAPIPSAP